MSALPDAFEARLAGVACREDAVSREALEAQGWAVASAPSSWGSVWMTRDAVEEWRPVVGHESSHSVSNLGRVRSEVRWMVPRVRLLRTFPARGYPSLSLSNGTEKPVRRTVHQLVAAAFIGPCPDGLQVNHINGIRTDNRADNLEYVTPGENSRHAERLGLIKKSRAAKNPSRGEDRPQSKLTEEKVVEARGLRAAGATYQSLADRYGVYWTVIYKAVNGLTWRHVGSVWMVRPVRDEEHTA